MLRVVRHTSTSGSNRMSSRWRIGEFDKKLVPELFHPFVPSHAVNTLVDIDLDKLWEGGKRLILLDVDHTIVKWKAEEFAQPVLDWITKAKKLGFDLCIISNTRRPARLGRLCKMLDIETVKGKFKPSAEMFHLAMAKFNRKPEETVMVGDQMMTDIFGANRAGINAIWVKKMDGKEFVGTRVNRFMEWILQSIVYKALIAPIDEESGGPEIEGSKPLKDRTIVHQLVKFMIVGGSSFIIDAGIRGYLSFYAHWHDQLLSQVFGTWLRSNYSFFYRTFDDPGKAAFPFFVAVGATFGILNSFIWNRRWTFEIRGKEERLSQLRRFLVVSLIGFALNVLISGGLNNVIPGHPKMSAAISTVIATIIVAFWNFTGQRFYAFRRRKP